MKIHSAFLYVCPKCANGIKHIELYTELCNLSKYYYAMKKGLTKQNYTKYTKNIQMRNNVKIIVKIHRKLSTLKKP